MAEFRKEIIDNKKALPASTAVLVQSVAGQGAAAPGNDQPADFLVVVTDPLTGEAVTGLIQKNFTIINHFSIPGAACGFSKNITSFADIGTGAYQIQVKPKGCKWVKGDYLAQVAVPAKSIKGQTVATLSIK